MSYNPTVTKRKAKSYNEKNERFLITKAQLTLMKEIYTIDKAITMYTQKDDLVINFICYLNNHKINRLVMLALLGKQLIRYEYRLLTFTLTKLGARIMKHKMKNPNTSGLVYAESKNMALTSDLKKALKSSIALGINI